MCYKIGILNHGEEETFGDVAQDGVVDWQWFWFVENGNVLSSTLVMLHRARAPVFLVALWANNVTGSDFTRFTNNWSSKNLNMVFESASFLIMYNEGQALVNLICRLTPGRRTSDMLNRSLCKRPKSCNSILALCLSQLVMNPRLFVAVTVAVVGLHVSMSPVSGYK